MNDIDDLKAVADQLMIENARLSSQVDALFQLIVGAIGESIPQPAAHVLMKDYFRFLEHRTNTAFDGIAEPGLLFGKVIPAKLKFREFQIIHDLKRKFQIDD
jgi:hypothetical protein